MLSLTSLDQVFQLIAWIMALINLILAGYALVINLGHPISLYLSSLLALSSGLGFLHGWLLSTSSKGAADIPGSLLAILLPIFPLWTLFSARQILRENQEKTGKETSSYPITSLSLAIGRFVWVVMLAILVLAPGIITVLDRTGATSLWFTGIDPLAAQGERLPLEMLFQGQAAAIIRLVYFALPGLALVAWLIFLLVRRIPLRVLSAENPAVGAQHTEAAQQTGVLTEQYTGQKYSGPQPSEKTGFQTPSFLILEILLVLAAESVALLVLFIPGLRLQVPFVLLLVTNLPALALASAGFARLFSERRYQRFNLQLRLNLLVLVVSLPVLVGGSLYLTDQTRQRLENDAVQSLTNTNQALYAAVDTWLDFNVRALRNLAAQGEIISLDPLRQKPLLEAMHTNYPQMYLVSVTDLTGINTARSDTSDLVNYADRQWFQEVRDGADLAFQTLIGRTSKRPALVAAVPLAGPDGSLLGVCMFATNLDVISARVRASRIGANGFSYVVDDQNQVVAHPQYETSEDLVDLSAYPAVAGLRQEGLGTGSVANYSFTDVDGIRWRATLQQLPNGWGIIAQAPETDILAPVRDFQTLSFTILVLSALLLILLPWLAIRQSLQPVSELTQAAQAISQGDLNRVALVEGSDELAVLAGSFNKMTTALADSLATQEQNVHLRTRDLERRAVQLRVVAEVAGEANQIQELDQLLQDTVHLISERFGFYHAGIFLMDAADEFAVLAAASSAGGQRMVTRGHRLRVGREGIVGYVAFAREPRVALDVGGDAVFFNNPDLPKTRSEAAVPLIARKQIIGVLDVQSELPAAFSPEDIEILQILANQVALAIDNTRLLAESRQALQELEKRLGTTLSQAWRSRLGSQVVAFKLDRLGIHPSPEVERDVIARSEATTESQGYLLEAPIELRGLQLGVLTLRRSEPWLPQEEELVHAAVEQVALALESARLLEEIQRRAEQERLISQITARLQASLSLDSVMQTTVQELGQTFGLPRLQIRLRGNGAEGTQGAPKEAPGAPHRIENAREE